jgi:hypothetical protein
MPRPALLIGVACARLSIVNDLYTLKSIDILVFFW